MWFVHNDDAPYVAPEELQIQKCWMDPSLLDFGPTE